MKVLLITIMTSTMSSIIMAKEINPTEADYNTPMTDLISDSHYSVDMKVMYLTRLLTQQQVTYEAKLAYLENELNKTKERLIQKSMNQEKVEERLIEKYSKETLVVKKELAYKTKSLLEYQRQIEKMKPNEDLKNMIKLNTELASELRKSEDQIAYMELKNAEIVPGVRSGSRLPASVKEGK